MKSKIYIFIIFAFILSCKEKERTFDEGYNYFPLAIGNYKIYDVIKTTYTSTNPVTETYQIKEYIADTITISSELKYRLERYKRATSSDNWPATPDSVWTASLYPNKAIKVENNVRYIKLVFPVQNGKTWNGNAENIYGEDDFKLQNVGKPYLVQNSNYSNTATVLQNDESTAINKTYGVEVYAKDIGLIYKEEQIYAYVQLNGTPQTGVIDYGIIYYERINSYGHQ